jgi:hypothetical protein
MIRLEGAEVLCNSLRTNRVLTNLDLSYNALGSAAAGVLGAALMENSVRVCLVPAVALCLFPLGADYHRLMVRTWPRRQLALAMFEVKRPVQTFLGVYWLGVPY